jgi:hypothetical protein
MAADRSLMGGCAITMLWRVLVAVGRSGGGADSLAEVLAAARSDPVGVLYRGLSENLVTVGVSNAVYFFFYNWLRNAVEKLRRRRVDDFTNLGIAYVAGAVNSVVTAPLWTVATRNKLKVRVHACLQRAACAMARVRGVGLPVRQRCVVVVVVVRSVAKAPRSRRGCWVSTLCVCGAAASRTRRVGTADGAAACVLAASMAEIVEKDGVGGLFNGLSAALVLCTNPAIQFASYEFLKTRALRYLGRTRQQRALVRSAVTRAVRCPCECVRGGGAVQTDFQVFLLSALAKTIATLVTYPMQVVQSKSQADSSKVGWRNARVR